MREGINTIDQMVKRMNDLRDKLLENTREKRKKETIFLELYL